MSELLLRNKRRHRYVRYDLSSGWLAKLIFEEHMGIGKKNSSLS